MKYFKLLYLILPFLVFSCDKDENNIETDNILFTDIIPDSTISSLDSLVYVGNDDWGDCYKPYPEDSTAYYNLDINDDNQIDFRISHSHWYGTEQWSPHNWCSVFDNYSIEIVSFNEHNEICADTNNDWPRYIPNQLKIGNRVDNDCLWNKKVTIYISSATCMCSYSSSSNYLGIRIKKNDIWYYGWLSMEYSEQQFTIIEYGINLTGNNLIAVGQKY
jgi:hypothetical protein